MCLRDTLHLASQLAGREHTCPSCGSSFVVQRDLYLVADQSQAATPAEVKIPESQSDLADLAKVVAQKTERKPPRDVDRHTLKPQSISSQSEQAISSTTGTPVAPPSGFANFLFVVAFMCAGCAVIAISNESWFTGVVLLAVGALASWVAIVVVRGRARMFKRNPSQFVPVVTSAPKVLNQPGQNRERTREYQRTCHRCGTVWYSLVSRERWLSFDQW